MDPKHVLSKVALAAALILALPHAGMASSASDRAGGSAQRGLSGGEALAQSFYERSVLFAKQRKYGQAVQLMERVVDKNPQNEKYRYFLSLLLYKQGNLTAAAQQARSLRNARVERYRLKSEALLGRITAAQRAQTPAPSYHRSSVPASAPEPGKVMQVGLGTLPDDAYFNVAGALRDSLGRASKRNASSGSKWKSVRSSDKVVETMVASALQPTKSRAGMTESSSGDPSKSGYGWIDPTSVKKKKAKAAKKASSSKPKATKKPKKSTPARAPVAEVDTADAFGDVWGEEPAAPPEPEPAPEPMVADASPAADSDFGDAFSDGFTEEQEAPADDGFDTPEEPAAPAAEESFGDEFGSFEESAPADPPAPEPEPAAEDAGFGEEFGGFGEEEAAPAEAPAASGDDGFGDFGEDDFGDF